MVFLSFYLRVLGYFVDTADGLLFHVVSTILFVIVLMVYNHPILRPYQFLHS